MKQRARTLPLKQKLNAEEKVSRVHVPAIEGLACTPAALSPGSRAATPRQGRDRHPGLCMRSAWPSQSRRVSAGQRSAGAPRHCPDTDSTQGGEARDCNTATPVQPCALGQRLQCGAQGRRGRGSRAGRHHAVILTLLAISSPARSSPRPAPGTSGTPLRARGKPAPHPRLCRLPRPESAAPSSSGSRAVRPCRRGGGVGSWGAKPSAGEERKAQGSP